MGLLHLLVPVLQDRREAREQVLDRLGFGKMGSRLLELRAWVQRTSPWPLKRPNRRPLRARLGLQFLISMSLGARKCNYMTILLLASDVGECCRQKSWPRSFIGEGLQASQSAAFDPVGVQYSKKLEHGPGTFMLAVLVL